MEFLFNEMTMWLLGTAVIFTFVGRYFFFKENVSEIVDSTIDSLIQQGFIKVEGEDIIKWEDWCKEND